MSTIECEPVEQSAVRVIEDDNPIWALKINKGLSMGYDYELIRHVLQQQTNDHDDMSTFIETIVRTAEMNKPMIDSSPMRMTELPYDVFIIDGVDLASSDEKKTFSWRRIELCVKYLHSHGHRKIFVVLPYSMKYHRYESEFTESKSLRKLERKHHIIYTNRLFKRANQHLNELLKFTTKNQGFLISNVSFKEIITNVTIYKQTMEEKIVRYQFENESFQPLLVSISHEDDRTEQYYPLCPYGKKCTYGFRCKYFHRKSRDVTSFVTSENRLEDVPLQSSSVETFQEQELNVEQFEQNVCSYFSTLAIEQECLAEKVQSVRHLWDDENSPNG